MAPPEASVVRARLQRLILVPALAGAWANAQQAPPAEDPLDAILNTKVEGAALRLQKAFVSPQAVESVERDRIAATGAWRIADLLKYFNNVQVWEGDTAFTRVGIRGGVGATVPRTAQILLDGVPLFNWVQGAADLGALPVPVEAVEKIEVIRGPASSLYGADAQQGVILITTRRAREGVRASARAGTAENGTFRCEGFASAGLGDLDLTGGFGAWSVRPLKDPYVDIRGGHAYVPDNRAHGQSFFLRPEWRVVDGSLWAYAAWGRRTFDPETAEGGAPGFPPLYRVSWQSSTQGLAQAGWKRDWSAQVRTELKVHRVVETLGAGAPTPIPGSALSAAAVAALRALDPALAGPHDYVAYTGTGASFQASLDPDEGLHLVLGADGCRIRADQSLLLGFQGIQRESASGVFASVDWDRGALTWSASLRAGHDTLGGSRLAPRLALAWTLGDGSVLRAGWFTSTRSPQLFEKRSAYDAPIFPYAMNPSPGLGPEKAENLELGWRKAVGRITGSATLFRTAFRDLIYQAVTPASPKAQAQYLNRRDGAVNTGLELALRGEILPGCTFGLTSAFMRFIDPATDHQTAYAPRIQASAWIRWRKGPWDAYAAGRHLGAVDRWGVDNGVVSGESPDSFILDFHVSRRLGSGLRLGAYGSNALRRSSPSGNDASLNATLVRYARREVGLQLAWRP